MTYFTDLNTYLHQSSLLISAYPTTRITTKYSLPRKRNPQSKKPEHPRTEPSTANGTTTTSPEPDTTTKRPRDRDRERERERLAPAATLTLKTYEPGSGICLTYKTDKAAEVGRLMGGLGRLAMGEVIEMPTKVDAKGEDKMEVDAAADVGSGAATPRVEEGKAPVVAGGQAGGGGKSKKKKGKR